MKNKYTYCTEGNWLDGIVDFHSTGYEVYKLQCPCVCVPTKIPVNSLERKPLVEDSKPTVRKLGNNIIFGREDDKKRKLDGGIY